MNDKPSDTLVQCEKCGSTEFCITQELACSFMWVTCRQCDTIFGITYKRVNLVGKQS